MFWNKQIPGKKPASKLKPQFKGEKEKKNKDCNYTVSQYSTLLK